MSAQSETAAALSSQSPDQAPGVANQVETSKSKLAILRGPLGLVCGAVALVLAGNIGWTVWSARQARPVAIAPQPAASAAVVPVIAPFPRPGTVAYFGEVAPEDLAAVLTINVGPGADDMTVLRLAPSGGAPFADVYLTPGTRVDVGLPAGRFTATAFSGSVWKGQARLFGADSPGVEVDTMIMSTPRASLSLNFGD